MPVGLKPFLKSPSLPTAALPKVRAALESDADFRALLGTVAVAELVDEVGRLWLVRPEGWLDTALALVDAAGAGVVATVGESTARSERKRREAAEAATVRSRVEVAAVQAQLAEAQARIDAVLLERDALDATLARVTRQLDEARAAGRKAAAKGAADELAALTQQVEAARAETAEVRAVLERVLAERAEAGPPAEVGRLRELLLEALALTGDVSGAPRRVRRTVRREPVAVPGGMYGNSEAAADFLLRVPNAVVLVDGYNVAKLGWPGLSLEQQRDQVVRGCEGLAAARGTNIHVVFDGSDDVEGGHVRQGRLVRVSWSPSGVSADDVVRVEVKAIDPQRPVVVVTNDKAIIADVKADGANPVSSDTFLAVIRR